MLLQQALYEINQQLPLPADATSSQIRQANRAVGQNWASGERVTKGHSNGSIGSYEFSFIHSSREFKNLEDQLLERGYKLNSSSHSFLSKDYYTHPTLPPMVISLEPLEIQETTLENLHRL